jgi:hypothetical protein
MGYVALFLFLALYLLNGAAWDFPLREWTLKHWIAAVLGAACLLAAFTYPFKAVRLEEGAISDNVWFLWRRQKLPQHVAVARDNRGRVVLTNADTGDVILSLAREFGPLGEIEAKLKAWLRRQQRLA